MQRLIYFYNKKTAFTYLRFLYEFMLFSEFNHQVYTLSALGVSICILYTCSSMNLCVLHSVTGGFFGLNSTINLFYGTQKKQFLSLVFTFKVLQFALEELLCYNADFYFLSVICTYHWQNSYMFVFLLFLLFVNCFCPVDSLSLSHVEMHFQCADKDFYNREKN